ncbi:MAG: TPM domain-containing protein [Candidatus Cloacimonadota bacterium]|nr:TPM domain-containing protein [Candidatus Cloacimonadota bacterium]
MKRNILILVLLFITALSFAKVPTLNSRVTDNANILTSSQQNDIETYLAQIERKTSSQVALLTVNSTNGIPIESYSMEVVDKWKLGQKGRDNGVLLLIALNDRKVRIEAGYGLEGILTDLKSGFIIREMVVKNFKKGDYYSGISEGLKAIGGLISFEYVISDKELAKYKNQNKRKKRSNFSFGGMIFLFMIVSSLFRGRRGRRGSGLLPLLLLGSLSSGSRSSGSGFGGGGFGGFSGGGGGFGGGGASGGW